MRLRAGSLLGHRRPKGEEEASSYTSLGTPRPAKGTAASTSSQPQAVMDSSADTSAPLASLLAGGRRLLPWDAGFSIGCPASKSSSVRGMPSAKLSSKRSCSSNRSHPDQSETRQEPKRTGSGCPHRRSGSEADSMSRGGYPVTGRPPSKSSSIGHIRSNEAALTRTTPDTNLSAPGAGAPTGDFWKRSGQHEPRRVPGRGAPLIGVVFRWAHTFQRSRPHQNDTRQEPKRTGSGYPHRRSGSEADSMSRGGYPVTGRPPSKSSFNRYVRSTEPCLFSR